MLTLHQCCIGSIGWSGLCLGQYTRLELPLKSSGVARQPGLSAAKGNILLLIIPLWKKGGRYIISKSNQSLLIHIV